MKTNDFFRTKRMLFLTAMSFIGTIFFAHAAGTIKGRVMNAEKQPVEYAVATLTDAQTNKVVNGDMCNQDGAYELRNVQPGVYILCIRIMGYEKNESELIVVDSDNAITENQPVVLNETIYCLPEVEVLGQAPEKAVSTTRTAQTNS